MSLSGDVNKIYSAHDYSEKRLENTEICFIMFPFLDAVATQLLQKLVKGLASLIYLKTYTHIVLWQHTTLCPDTWVWTTGLAHMLPSLQMFHKTKLQNQKAAFLESHGDTCFRQVSLIRLGIQPITRDILNGLLYMQTMKTQFSLTSMEYLWTRKAQA